MSCYHDLYCRACKADCGFHWNRGGQQLAAIWQHRAAFIELGKLSGVITEIDNALPSGVHVEFELKFYGPESGGYDLPEFAAAHHDHDVVVRDEYGRFSDQCSEWLDSGYACSAAPGHEGPHVPRKLREEV